MPVVLGVCGYYAHNTGGGNSSARPYTPPELRAIPMNRRKA